MGDASERRKDAEGRAAELDDFTIAKNGSRKYAILVLRRKGGNQVEEFSNRRGASSYRVQRVP